MSGCAPRAAILLHHHQHVFAAPFAKQLGIAGQSANCRYPAASSTCFSGAPIGSTYPSLGTQAGGIAMDLNEAIAGRRAVREYTDEAVDKRTIRNLIAAAVQAPSAVNQQPWTFTVVRDQSVLDRLSNEAKTHMLANLPVNGHADHFRSLLGEPTFQIFYHAPVLILIAARAPGPWNLEDCALAAQNLMLAAYAAGLGSCWIGFAQHFLNTPAGKHLLALPADCVPVAPIIVGHAKTPPPPVPRKDPEIHWLG
jgi:nitroreductase